MVCDISGLTAAASNNVALRDQTRKVANAPELQA